MLICGIDEAGRGPVLGPLVMAGVLAKGEDLDRLKAIGVKDSKLLTEKQREDLYDKIIEVVERFVVVSVPPKEIDEAVDGDNELNLNWLEAVKTADILNELQPEKAYVDCPSTNTWKYEQYLKKLLKSKMELVVEHKADVNYIASGAASILAKVERDRAIKKIKEEYGDCGPGYPSNPITQRFVKENWDKHPEIFRKSWATYKKIVKDNEQKDLGEF
tara:strand:- start:2268 stop:2918 length:651 start_codon:yes stop_codon:yes gene_type:complete